MRIQLSVAVAMCALCSLGCEPEIGAPCDDNKDDVAAAIEQSPGSNNLVQDVSLDNCSQGFCLSDHGSRPFCTIQCQADAECAVAGEGFICEAVISFGPLACIDFEDPTKEQPAHEGESSFSACTSDTDCTVAGEQCFLSGEHANTCGFVGRDCLTGENGGPSESPLKYCTASPEVIKQRDIDFGRKPSNVE
jgi:hypothetical protein